MDRAPATSMPLAMAAPTIAPSPAELWREHHADLVRHCNAILHNPDDAADAAQETWVRALVALEGGSGPQTPRPWLFAVARNVATDVIRRQRNMAFAPIDEDALPAGETVEDKQRTSEQLRSLVGDLRSLSDQQRNALVQRELGGLNDGEIALRLGTTPERVDALIGEGRRTLRELAAGRRLPCESVEPEIRRLAVHGRQVRAHIDGCAACRRLERRVRGRRLSSRALLPFPFLRQIGEWASMRVAETGAGAAKLTAAVAITASVGGGLASIDSPLPRHDPRRSHALANHEPAASPPARTAERRGERAPRGRRARASRPAPRKHSVDRVAHGPAASAPRQTVGATAPSSPHPAPPAAAPASAAASSQRSDTAARAARPVQAATQAVAPAAADAVGTVQTAARSVVESAGAAGSTATSAVTGAVSAATGSTAGS
jgi:RNA polymerase sigma-70 factor (ECF subfamily)